MNPLCSYCGKEPATDKDHIVPKSLMRTHKLRLRELRLAGELPLKMHVLRETVPACRTCNENKGNRRLVPHFMKWRIPAYSEIFPGTPWRVWRGSTSEPAYRDTHLAVTA